MTHPMEGRPEKVPWSVSEDFVIDSEVFLITGVTVGFILRQKLLSLSGETASAAAFAANAFFCEGKLQNAFRPL